MSKSSISFCISNEVIRFEENWTIVDYNKIFPDPYRDWDYWSTWICRNTHNSSLQHIVKKRIRDFNDKVYILYCWDDDYWNKWLRGLLKIEWYYNNHYEHDKNDNNFRPNNLVKQEKNHYRKQEYKNYFKRINHPYIYGKWEKVISEKGINLWNTEYFNNELKKIYSKKLGWWLFRGRWINKEIINTEKEMYEWIENLINNANKLW